MAFAVGGLGFRREIADFARHRFRGEGRAFDPAIMQRLAPELLEVGASVLLLPVGADEIISSRVGLPGEQRDEFQRALAVVERSDQRLDDADGAVVGAGIAPGFEFVRRADVPLAEFGGFVLIEAVVHAQRNFAVLQSVGEVQIGGRVVGGIAAEDDQQIDFAAVHVGDEIFDRLGLIDRIRVDGIGVEDGLADVAKRLRSCRAREHEPHGADDRQR